MEEHADAKGDDHVCGGEVEEEAGAVAFAESKDGLLDRLGAAEIEVAGELEDFDAVLEFAGFDLGACGVAGLVENV